MKVDFTEAEVNFLRALLAQSNVSGQNNPAAIRAFASVVEKLNGVEEHSPNGNEQLNEEE